MTTNLNFDNIYPCIITLSIACVCGYLYEAKKIHDKNTYYKTNQSKKKIEFLEKQINKLFNYDYINYKNIQKLQDHFEKFEKTVDEQFESFDEKCFENFKKLKYLENECDFNYKRIKELEDDCDDNYQRIKDLEDDCDDNYQRIKDLEDDFDFTDDDNHQRLKDLEESLKTFKDSFHDNNGNINSNFNKLNNSCKNLSKTCENLRKVSDESNANTNFNFNKMNNRFQSFIEGQNDKFYYRDIEQDNLQELIEKLAKKTNKLRKQMNNVYVSLDKQKSLIYNDCVDTNEMINDVENNHAELEERMTNLENVLDSIEWKKKHAIKWANILKKVKEINKVNEKKIESEFDENDFCNINKP